ncbi:HlyD family efflux transporter periplasmic adaptor subunit [Aquimarina sp. LLG6339-5]|uniref:HlyD family efflux transporter periplasmic adaptor subunit n=1 Tax=Aquimarina sp. LLG6339-5 TaxID=3160830 RepID=UPI00386DF956
MEQQIEQIKLRSEEVQEVLSQIPNWMVRWGSLLFLILIMMLLFLSYFIKYPDIIVSESIITTEIPPEKVYAKINEKIEIILINDGQYVKDETPLAILENNANYKDVFLLKSIADTITLNNTFFDFPFTDLPILFLGDVAENFALFENSYSAYTLHKKLKPFSNEAMANQLSLSEQKRRLQSYLSQKKISYKELVLQRKDLERQQTLFNKGVISEQEYENEKLEMLQVERNYTNMDITISQIRETISAMNKTFKGTQIDKTKEDIKLFNSVIQSFNQLKKAIKNWELQYVLKSNSSGTVAFMNYWSSHQSVVAEEVIFTIIPSQNKGYIGKLEAPSQNSGKIKIGQKVHFKLDNYPSSEFGILSGTIKKISALPNKEGLYLIDVKLPDQLITSYKKEIGFKQEMKSTAEIVTEDLRLIERFFYQLTKIMDSRGENLNN